jgi:transposase InsO family protein
MRTRYQLHFITPGRPMENGYIESFNGKFLFSATNTAFPL